MKRLDYCILQSGDDIYYTGGIKKTEQIWNAQFRKTAISIQFLIYIVSLGTL
jgi:hypothetical protein